MMKTVLLGLGAGYHGLGWMFLFLGSPMAAYICFVLSLASTLGWFAVKGIT